MAEKDAEGRPYNLSAWFISSTITVTRASSSKILKRIGG